jgi:hypothetical protein
LGDEDEGFTVVEVEDVLNIPERDAEVEGRRPGPGPARL